jgi:DNA-binding IclR family transcriptional regulator
MRRELRLNLARSEPLSQRWYLDPDRIVEVLVLVAVANRAGVSPGLRDLADVTGMPEGTVSHYCSTFVKRGWLRVSPSGRGYVATGRGPATEAA